MEQPDVDNVVEAAVRAVEGRYGVTIAPEAREVLLKWAASNTERIAAQVARGWTSDQFVEAARKVLEAAAVDTINPPGVRYFVDPDNIQRDRVVGAFATAKALPGNCPFYGC